MNIQVLGAHNCESQKWKLVSLMVDDILVMDAGALTSSLSLPSQQKLKAILLTHQHYDHIRDIPTIAMNLFLSSNNINVYSTPPVYDALTTHLLNGKLYPNFMETPQPNPTIRFITVEPYKTEQIEGYNVLPIPVNHSAPTIGYQITSPEAKTVFYTGDTGPGLADCWQHISPDLLIIEVTAPNKYEEFGREAGHLTPSLLKQELTSFQELKGYLPQVALVHMNPSDEEQIRAEVAAVANELDNPITLAYEGMQISLE